MEKENSGRLLRLDLRCLRLPFRSTHQKLFSFSIPSLASLVPAAVYHHRVDGKYRRRQG
jgi:hypothetical protein